MIALGRELVLWTTILQDSGSSRRKQGWYRFGSGLDGHSIAEELTQLLALLMEPVGSHAWLVDWLWHLYKESLQPFLMLAGPASDGLAVMRFREMWGCLPWHQATFHSSSPGVAYTP